MLTTLEGEKKEYCNFSKKILALVAIQQQVEMTFVSSLVLSALRKCRKKIAHMVSFRKLCSKQNKMDCKVTFESTSKRSQVHNVKSTVCVCVYLDISCCVRGLCSDPSPPPSRERGKDHSFFKVSLSSLPHHTILWGRARGSGTSRQDWLFIHPPPPLFLSSFLFPFPLHFSGALLALFDLKTFKFYFSFLWFPRTLSICINFALLSSLSQCLSF